MTPTWSSTSVGFEDGFPDEEGESRLVAEALAEQLSHDGSPEANLAGYTTPWMEPEVDRLLVAAARKNAADRGAYPVVAEFERRCVAMLGGLFHCPATGAGTSTVGSSEALYMALAVHRDNWRNRGGRGLPNVVSGDAAHVSVHKFAAFFDVELRVADPQAGIAGIGAQIDERTIAIIAVLGKTETGEIDDVESISALAARDRVPVHVDAASGGLVLPFSNPERRWDFRLPSVSSINVSGHKFGLAYPGVAWLLLRDRSHIPAALVHRVAYLAGGEIEDFSLNFTRSASGIVAQYYSFLRYGQAGYRRAVSHAMALTRRLADGIGCLAEYRVLRAPELPVLCFSAHDPDFDIAATCAMLQARGWIVTAYRLTGSATYTIRIVVKPSMTASIIDRFVADLSIATRQVVSQPLLGPVRIAIAGGDGANGTPSPQSSPAG